MAFAPFAQKNPAFCALDELKISPHPFHHFTSTSIFPNIFLKFNHGLPRFNQGLTKNSTVWSGYIQANTEDNWIPYKMNAQGPRPDPKQARYHKNSKNVLNT